MDQKLNNAYNALEKKLDELEDDYLSGKIDDASFAEAVIITRLEKKILPYHEELKKLNIKIDGHIGLIIGLLSGRHLTPKEEQQVKEKLIEIKKIFNKFDSSEDKKEKNIADTFEKIEELLIKISDTEIVA